ncbi:MAG: flagellar filament capping protein FliD [Gammaproteobacteria bacterium]|nr:flagellar filament capping protein FliD [Gammaproteobacteria bacterium]
MGISSVGVGSGIDVGGLVDRLISAEGAPKTNRYNRKEADIQAKLTSLGTLKGALSDFQMSFSALKYASSFTSIKASSSQSAIFSASAAKGAAVGNYSLEVSKLAQAHSVATKAGTGLTSLGSQIGTGSITIDFGTWDNAAAPPTFTANPSKTAKTINITDGSISGIRDAINKANVGVNANIIYDGSNYRLSLTSSTGAANAMRISTVDNDGNNTDSSGLSMLAFDKDTGSAGFAMNLDENTLAQDAEIAIDGLIVHSATNVVTDVIKDVTINLKSAQVGTKGVLSVAADTTAITSGVQKFVDSFNGLVGTLKQLSFYNAETGDRGVFLGDSAVRNIESGIRRIMGQAFGSQTGAYNSLASLGITTQRDGSLQLDSAKLDKALSANLEDVRMVFAGGYSKPGGSSVSYNKLPSGMDAGSIPINITQAATQGTYVADVLANSTISAGNDSFVLNVNGVATGTITVAAGVYSGSTLATEIQTQLNADSVGKDVLVSYNASTNKLEFTNKNYGSTSAVTVSSTSGTFAADTGVGGAAGVATAGKDIAGTLGGNSTQGNYIAAALSTTTVTSGNNQFVLNVNGSNTGTITIPASAYADGDALAAAIQTRLTVDSVGKNVKVSYNSTSNKLEFYSTSFGATSNVTVVSTTGTLAADIGLGGAGGVSTQGQGLAGTTFAATGAGQVLTGSGTYAGVEIQYTGTSSVYVRATTPHVGVIKELNKFLDDALLTNGTLNAKTKSYRSQIDDINEDRKTLSTRLESMQASLLKKFGAMDSLVAQLNGTSTYLSGQFQQLANLNKQR